MIQQQREALKCFITSPSECKYQLTIDYDTYVNETMLMIIPLSQG